jgi:hypothetical protein
MTNSRSAGDAKESLRNTSRVRGNSTAKDVKQQTNLPKSTVEALNAALDAMPVQYRTTGTPCAIYRLHKVLPKDMGDKILMLIDTSKHTSVQIANTLNEFEGETGIAITSWIVQKHRRRLRNAGCSCNPTIGEA